MARSGLEKIIDRSAPESVEATQWLARCHLKEGSPDKAIKIADKGLRKIKDRSARTELELVRIDAMYDWVENILVSPTPLNSISEAYRQSFAEIGGFDPYLGLEKVNFFLHITFLLIRSERFAILPSGDNVWYGKDALALRRRN